MVKAMDGKVDIALTDTDSFLLVITAEDFYSKLENIRSWFDFSNYDENHPLHSDENRKVPGKYVTLHALMLLCVFGHTRPCQYYDHVTC